MDFIWWHITSIGSLLFLFSSKTLICLLCSLLICFALFNLFIISALFSKCWDFSKILILITVTILCNKNYPKQKMAFLTEFSHSREPNQPNSISWASTLSIDIARLHLMVNCSELKTASTQLWAGTRITFNKVPPGCCQNKFLQCN